MTARATSRGSRFGTGADRAVTLGASTFLRVLGSWSAPALTAVRMRAWLQLGVAEKALEVGRPIPDASIRPLLIQAQAEIEATNRRFAHLEAAAGHLDNAIGWLDDSIEAGYATPWTWLWHARYLSRSHRSSEALTSCRRALELDASFEPAQALLSSLTKARALAGDT